jgi:hypothetical protein
MAVGRLYFTPLSKPITINGNQLLTTLEEIVFCPRVSAVSAQLISTLSGKQPRVFRQCLAFTHYYVKVPGSEGDRRQQ